jgi:hypothetical protein
MLILSPAPLILSPARPLSDWHYNESQRLNRRTEEQIEHWQLVDITENGFQSMWQS